MYRPDILVGMIFAAGRGTRLRPLTDTCPKPLLKVNGKPLIVWQIERLAHAGFKFIVINHAWLGTLIEAALGDGAQWGVHIYYSAEREALETAGAIAHALPLLEGHGQSSTFVAVSGDIFTDYDYRALVPKLQRMANAAEPQMHLVMVPNPPDYPLGDFALEDGQLSLDGTPRWAFSGIGVYDTRMFYELSAGVRCPLTPYYQATIAACRASGELYTGHWVNVSTSEQLHTLDSLIKSRGGGGTSHRTNLSTIDLVGGH